MTKNEFMNALRSREELFGLPEEDIARSLSFYEELINDRMEEGMSEEEAVADVGNPKEIAAQILSEIPLSKLVKKKMKPSRRLRAWEIVLLALGSPLWLTQWRIWKTKTMAQQNSASSSPNRKQKRNIYRKNNKRTCRWHVLRLSKNLVEFCRFAAK